MFEAIIEFVDLIETMNYVLSINHHLNCQFKLKIGCSSRLRNKLFRWKPRKHLAITSFILEIISSSMQRFLRYSARLPPSSTLNNNEFTQSAKHEISADIFIKRKSFTVADEDKKKITRNYLFLPSFELPSLKHRSRCKNIFSLQIQWMLCRFLNVSCSASSLVAYHSVLLQMMMMFHCWEVSYLRNLNRIAFRGD